MNETSPITVKMAMAAWDNQIKRLSQLLEGFTDDQLMREVSPGRNRAIYLVGHLIAVHDAMNDILGLGKRAHSDLDEALIQKPDKSGIAIPSATEMRKYWKDVHQNLRDAMQKLSPEEWFSRHNAMTDEDFQKDPSRNKLNVLLSRTGHAAYHSGQLHLLK